jgi:hypothetical protein
LVASPRTVSTSAAAVFGDGTRAQHPPSYWVATENPALIHEAIGDLADDCDWMIAVAKHHCASGQGN